MFFTKSMTFLDATFLDKCNDNQT